MRDGGWYTMKTNNLKPLIAFLICIIIMVSAMSIAYGFKTDFGNIDISTLRLQTDNGHSISYKIYVPDTATAEQPAPSVLLIHGYQNDKDTSSACYHIIQGHRSSNGMVH